MKPYILFLSLFFSGFAGGCTELASVQTRTPPVPHYSASSNALLVAADRLSKARKVSEQTPLNSLGEDIAAARIALNQLVQNQHQSQARELYNFAVARIVEDLQRIDPKPWGQAITVPSSDGSFVLSSFSPAANKDIWFGGQVVPADKIKLGSRLFTSRSIVKGVGAPVVTFGPTEPSTRRAQFEPEHLYAAETAAITFKGHRARFDFVDPLSTDRISIDGHSYPLAADFSAPLGLGMVRERPNRIGAAALFWPDKYRKRARLVRLEPFDATRTPVIFVHGLASGPLFWTPMINDLVADPEIRRRFQFWVFWYPTGYPFPYSALQLRQELDRIHQTFPNSKRVILIGHSLGGLVVRLLVTDAGNSIWRDLFGESPTEMQLSGNTAKVLEQSLIFNHRPDVERAIFITTPHRGTTVASHWWTRMAARLIKQPRSFNAIRLIANSDPAAQHLNRIPNCIETLAPNDPIVLALSKLPVSSKIPFHTIEGDRGRGDAPNSNDGIVAYWSSHLSGAASELVIPSGHAAQVHPAGIAEVRRILRSSN